MARSLNPSAPVWLLDGGASRSQSLFMGLQVTESEAQRATLIRNIAERQDRESFIALFEYYAPRIKSQALRNGLAADSAEDVAQDAMLSLWRRAGQFDPTRGSASAWVFTIATNARIDRQRRDGRLKASADLDAALAIPAEIVENNSADAARLARLVEQLPAEQRQVLDLSFFRDIAHSEIAQQLGIPLGTVKSRIRLAVGKLRALMRDEP